MAAMVNPSYWYCGSDKWTAVTAWAANIAKSVGNLVRQNAAPTVGNERVFVCIVAGTTTNGTEPTWTVTKGAKTTDNTVTWMECTGQPGVNGNTTDCQTWTANAKSNTVALGQIIYDSGTSSLQICTTAGTAGSGAAPSFSGTAGTTTADNTVTWTSLGAASNFGTWAAPHDRLGNAHTANWMAAGNTLFISSAHAETAAAANNLNLQGTFASPTYNLSVNAANSATSGGCTLLAGASVATTGTNNITILSTSTPCSYLYGITFTGGSAANQSVITIGGNGDASLYFDTCTFTLNNTSTTSSMSFGNVSASTRSMLLDLQGCIFTFGNASQTIKLYGATTNLVNGTFANSGTVPTNLFTLQSLNCSLTSIRDSDISAITGTLVAGVSGTSNQGNMIIANSKLGAAVTMTNGAPSPQISWLFRLHNCDSGSKNYRFYERNYMATIQQETTIVNTGGATDGTTPISWNIATSANVSFAAPYQSMEITQWQDTTGSSKTATVEIAGANTLTNDDIWMEIEYLGNASFPIASVANNRKSSIVASNTNVTSSAASWGGSPASTQKLQITFTPQMKGPIKARIFVAKPSITVYVDPLITVA